MDTQRVDNITSHAAVCVSSGADVGLMCLKRSSYILYMRLQMVKNFIFASLNFRKFHSKTILDTVDWHTSAYQSS